MNSNGAVSPLARADYISQTFLLDQSSVLYISFKAWDPDKTLERIDPYLSWMFTPGFVVFSIALFIAVGYILDFIFKGHGWLTLLAVAVMVGTASLTSASRAKRVPGSKPSVDST